VIIQSRGINDSRLARIVLIKPLRVVDKSISRREIFPAKRQIKSSRTFSSDPSNHSSLDYVTITGRRAMPVDCSIVEAINALDTRSIA
jgi:hypothetical protein